MGENSEASEKAKATMGKVGNGLKQGAKQLWKKIPLKIKLYIAGGVLALIIVILAVAAIVSYVDEVFDKSVDEEVLNEAQVKFKDNVEKVYKKIQTDTGVKIDRAALVSTIMYSGDYDSMYDEDEFDLEDILDEDGNPAAGATFLAIINAKWDQFTDTYFNTGKTPSGRELRKFRTSYSSLYKYGEFMINDNKLDLEHYEEKLITDVVPKIYSDLLDNKEEGSKYTAEKIAREIIDLADVYRPWFEEDEVNNCIVGGSFQATEFMNMTTAEYIEKMGPLAQAEYSRTGILASVKLAQSILESGWGKSGLTQKANNMFGIKCGSSWPSEKCGQWATTEEYTVGNVTNIVDGFRSYDSVEESIADHSDLLQKPRYVNAGVLDATTYEAQLTALHDAGYATNSDYVSKNVSLIKQYELDKWDVKINTTSSGLSCNGASAGLNGWSIRTIAPTKSDPAFTYNPSWSNTGQCVWYARARAIEIVLELEKNAKIDNARATQLISLINASYGDAGVIYTNTRGKLKGSSNIREPKAGSYIVWSQSGKWGHVAVIEDVDTANNKITITEGWSTGSGNVSCPSSWSCVKFKHQVYDLDTFYNNYGKHYTGSYNFVGYVYFLEPEGE